MPVYIVKITHNGATEQRLLHAENLPDARAAVSPKIEIERATAEQMANLITAGVVLENAAAILKQNSSKNAPDIPQGNAGANAVVASGPSSGDDSVNHQEPVSGDVQQVQNISGQDATSSLDKNFDTMFKSPETA